MMAFPPECSVTCGADGVCLFALRCLYLVLPTTLRCQKFCRFQADRNIVKSAEIKYIGVYVFEVLADLMLLDWQYGHFFCFACHANFAYAMERSDDEMLHRI